MDPVKEEQLEIKLQTKTSANDSGAGKIIAGKFEILSVIGAGGMSVVYKAKHLALNKVVAIKLLQSNRLDNERHIQRFQVEAQAATSLNHPNIASVREFGVDENSCPYLVMDYVEAVPLSKLTEDGPLPLARALKIATGLCQGLEHAHDHGVVHRDIKPGNILVAKNADGSDCPMIVDFGIARITDDEDRTRLTQTGEVFGTPAYMSPEQALGMPIDRRSDIYAAGCVLYEMLAGKQPFSADNPLTLLMKHLSEPPAPLVNVPAEIQSIVMKAMEKDPAARYESAGALRTAINQLDSRSHFVRMPELSYARTLALRLIGWSVDLAIVSLPCFAIACFLPQGLATSANRALSYCGLCEQCMPSFGITNIVSNSGGILLVGLALLICIANYLYHALMESSKAQATLGKQAVGLIVTTNSFGRLTFRDASYRHWSKIIYFGIFSLTAAMAGSVMSSGSWTTPALLMMTMIALSAIVLRKRYQLIHDAISAAKVVPREYASDAAATGKQNLGATAAKATLIVVSFLLLSFGLQLNLGTEQATALVHTCQAERRQHDYVSAEQSGLRALSILNSLPTHSPGFDNLLYDNIVELGSVYSEQNQSDKAAAMFQRALALDSVMKDDARKALVFLDIGSAYLTDRKLSEAQAAFERAAALSAKAADPFWEGVALAMIGNCYNGNNQLPLAQKYCLQAQKLLLNPPKCNYSWYPGSYRQFANRVLKENNVEVMSDRRRR